MSSKIFTNFSKMYIRWNSKEYIVMIDFFKL